METFMSMITVKLRIWRNTHWEDFTVHLAQEAYVLDALEAVSTQDTSLLYRHACHHASCGSCGLRVNGRERLACITPIAEVVNSKGMIRLEPLRNFPLIGDLLVDFQPFMQHLDKVDLPLRRSAEQLPEQVENAIFERIPSPPAQDNPEMPAVFNRLESCIECGLCVSACPIAGTDMQYLGPACLAAAGRMVTEPRRRSLDKTLEWVDDEHGLRRCHAAFECSEVCPADVDPAREILALRGHLLRRHGMS
jgi:succinate dehydrogenase / fumarate reductase iron-sulfur subunit